MHRLRSDLVLACRRLAHAPGFAFVAIATLALGIGANTAIFSLVSTVLLRPLPYGDPDRLVMLWGRMEPGATTWLSGPEVREYAAESDTFAGVSAYTSAAANLTGGPEPERVVIAAVTPDLFATLDVAPAIGRAFASSDRADEMSDQVVLAHTLWQRRFGGRSDIVGERILLDEAAHTVIGVMPRGFRLPLDFAGDRPSELWRPLDLRSPQWARWGNHSLIGVARLRRGVTPELATAVMGTLEDRWVSDGQESWTDRDIMRRAAIPVADLVLGDVRRPLWVLLGAVGMLLLIACANVANLTLARSAARERELAVCAALGASRARIVRQLLTESLLLSAIGGAAALGLAYVGMRLLHVLRPAGIPRADQIGMDAGVLAFALAITVATGILFGLAPALGLSRPDVGAALKGGAGTAGAGRGRQRFRDVLAVAQMALSVALLIGALLLVRSLAGLAGIDTGFEPRGALTARLVLASGSYAGGGEVIRAVRTLRQRLAELPGVRSAGATRLLPLTGTIGDWSITVEGSERRPGDNPNGDWQVVTPGYFESMGIPLVRGRAFAETDREDTPLVAVISETMAERYWPGVDAIGRRFHLGSGRQPWITIVGIAGHVKHNSLTERPRAEMYVPHAQWAAAGGGTPRAMTFVIRTAGDPVALVGHVRAAVRAVDPNLPLADIRTLEQVAAGPLAQARFTALLLGLLAALALTLAAVGLYGVMSLLVSRRRREIGIRMALGARPASILGMVVRRGLALAAIGASAGLLAAAPLTRVVARLLYGVTPLDPLTFAAVPAILVSVALLASLVPAARAARLNPVATLREE